MGALVGAPASALAAPTADAELGQWAKDRFLKHWNCAQAVVETFAARYRLDDVLLGKMTNAFAGGIGQGLLCGAYTGAYLVLGLAHGKSGVPTPEVAKRTVAFTRAAKAMFGPLDCSGLLGADMSTPEGVKQVGDKGLFTTKCAEIVAFSARELERLLA
jgi:C_GCAxxG_C_C family probable redox protein